jgi:hypothetical protein
MGFIIRRLNEARWYLDGWKVSKKSQKTANLTPGLRSWYSPSDF